MYKQKAVTGNGTQQQMKQNLVDTISKPLSAGLIAGVAGLLLGATDLGPMNIPSYVLLGGTVAASTAIAEIGKNYIIPKSNTSSVIQMIAEPALTGVSTVVVNSLLGASDSSAMIKVFLVGAISNVGSDYVARNVVTPLVSKFY